MKDIDVIENSVKAEGHTPQYKMHKYYARRPFNVFSNLIEYYTNENDYVLDVFCGGGVTLFESLALNRSCIGVDLNPLATLITKMQIFKGDIKEIEDLYNDFINLLRKKYEHLYLVKFSDDEGIAIWTEYAYLVECNVCGSEILLTDDNKKTSGKYYCENKNCINHTTGVQRTKCKQIGSKVLRVKYLSIKTNKINIRECTEDNILINKYNFDTNNFNNNPDFKMPNDWDRRIEDKFENKGINKYSDLFTKRNYYINCAIFNEIIKIKKNNKNKADFLYFLFSSSLRYTNKMSRVTENWENGNPTSMDKHAYWLPNVYVETNIIDILDQRSRTILSGLKYSNAKLPNEINFYETADELFKSDNLGYCVFNTSSTNLPINDKCIDVVITDPPYGSNVQYAELTTVWNAWYCIYNGNGKYIEKKEEAVVNRKKGFKGAKSYSDYEKLLTSVYKECNRVLKDNAYLVFTFNNKDVNVWISMLKAVANAGFYLPENGIIYQDYIESYKNTSHLKYNGNIQGDFIYSFKKGNVDIKNINDNDSILKIIDDSVNLMIKKMFSISDRYNNAELYQKLLEIMTKRIMEYIVYCVNKNKFIEDLSYLTSDYLDNELRKNLDYKDGIWKLKKN